MACSFAGKSARTILIGYKTTSLRYFLPVVILPFHRGQSAACIAAAGVNVYKRKNTGYCYE